MDGASGRWTCPTDPAARCLVLSGFQSWRHFTVMQLRSISEEGQGLKKKTLEISGDTHLFNFPEAPNPFAGSAKQNSVCALRMCGVFDIPPNVARSWGASAGAWSCYCCCCRSACADLRSAQNYLPRVGGYSAAEYHRCPRARCIPVEQSPFLKITVKHVL